jgi:hypothetical protein
VDGPQLQGGWDAVRLRLPHLLAEDVVDRARRRSPLH